jgi:outer membrane protein
MKRLIPFLAIPCFTQGIFAQGPVIAAVTDTSLRPISLQEAIQLAQRNAPTAVQARGQLRTTAAGVRSAYGAFLPSLNGSMGQSQQSGQRFDNSGRLVPYSANPWSFSTGLSANLQVFDGGRRFAELKSARADVHAAEANETAQQFSIALQVKTQYANILAARESEAAARAQLGQAVQQLNAATARVRAGAATMSDSLRTVIQVGNARLALLTAQNNVRVASATLTRLVATPFLVTATPADTLDRPLSVVDSLEIAQLAARGPAVQQAEAQANSARAAERAARTSYLPTVNLSYNYNGSGFDKYYGLGPGQLAYSKNLGIRLNYPIFDNFTREENVTRAAVAEDNAEAALRDTRLAAQQQIIQQFGALRTAEARIRIQQISVTSAEEDLRVQQQRYTLGASTLLDLLTSQTTLDQQRAALIQARQDYRIARAQIEAIIGRDLR